MAMASSCSSAHKRQHHAPLVFTSPHGSLAFDLSSSKQQPKQQEEQQPQQPSQQTQQEKEQQCVAQQEQKQQSFAHEKEQQQSVASHGHQQQSVSQQQDYQHVASSLPLPPSILRPDFQTPSKPPRLSICGLPPTPSTSQKKGPQPPSLKKIKLKAAMKLKALESQRVEDSRHEQDRTEVWLDRQEKAYCAWLNHVLLKPMKSKNAGCDIDPETASTVSNDSSRFSSVSELSHLSSDSAKISTDKVYVRDSASPAARKTSRVDKRNTLKPHAVKGKENSPLDASFQAICSIPVLRNRLEPFLDVKSREDVISTMLNLAKHIDEGRLKMKAGCTIFTDVALKEKFVQALLNYNTAWLKIGLHVVLGHTALLTKENLDRMPDDSEVQEEDAEAHETQRTVLRLIIEKHFLAHQGLAKYHATNKTIEGLYKQGYHEALGRVILKRLLLLVLALDKAKCQSALQLARGIDGLDGGSPLLFHANGTIKSSRQALQEFLLNTMHGEGDIVGHLGVLGYHVSHVQVGLPDYKFEVGDLIEDLQDGVRLCRLVQVLCSDASILVKIKLPVNHMRRRSQNCGIALEHLARAGVPLVDDHGHLITSDDLVEGNRPRIISLLWNIMLHLQIPILVSAQKLQQEIVKVQARDLESISISNGTSLVDLLLEWVQVISAKYGLLVENFTTSFADGQALCYLISFYLPMLLPCTAIQCVMQWSPQKPHQSPGYRISERTYLDQTPKFKNPDLRISVAQNFNLFRNAVCKLGHIPEVLQLPQFTDADPFPSERNIVILLAFLCYRLVEDKSRVEEKMAALSWDPGLAVRELKIDNGSKAGSDNSEEDIIVWHSAFKDFYGRQDFCRRRTAAIRIQAAVREWLASKSRASEQRLVAEESYHTLNAAAMPIQAHHRARLAKFQYRLNYARIQTIQRFWRARQARRAYLHQREACLKIQYSWRRFLVRKASHIQKIQLISCVTRIQAWWRKCQVKTKFLKQKAAVVFIQSCLRSYIQRKEFRKCKESALTIQAVVKGRYARRRYSVYRESVKLIQRRWRARLAKRREVEVQCAVKTIQACWRTCQERRSFIRKRAAAVRIQSCFRCRLQMKRYTKLKEGTVKLQALVRSKYQRKRFCTLIDSVKTIQRCWRRVQARRNALRKCVEIVNAATTIQAWLRKCFARTNFLKVRAAIIHIQGCIRSYLCSNKYKRAREAVVKIQACFRSRQERRRYIQCRDAASKIQTRFRYWLACRKRLRACMEIQSAKKIQAAWRLSKARATMQAHCKGSLQTHQLSMTQIKQIIRLQALVRGMLVRRQLLQQAASVSTMEQYFPEQQQIEGGAQIDVRDYPLSSDGLCLFKEATDEKSKEFLQRWVQMALQRRWFLCLRRCVPRLQRRWRCLLQLRCSAATTIQRHYRGWHERMRFLQNKLAIQRIQAVWRGCLVRQRNSHLRHQLSALRQRMQNTAANIDNKMRLEYRLTDALAALLSQKTVSGILHTCATIDLATQHSKLCCERLLEAGAIPKLVQLIKTTNRSPPHEEVLKHALSILANLARYAEFATLVANAPGCISTIAEQLLRNNEEVLSKVMKLLKLVCKVPSGLDVVRKNPAVLRRLHNISQALEKKVEVEARSLTRLPPNAPPVVRRAGEKKVTDAVSHHYSIALLLQAVTGEDIQARLKAVRRMSMVPGTARPSMGGRYPLHDCSNQ